QSRIATLFRELLASASLPETVARGEPAPASSSPPQSTPPHTPDSRRERPEPEATVIANANPAAAAAPGLATGSALPAFIGRFRVLRRLGSGGFGDVYLAEDDKLERRVAIKVPNARALREFGDNWSREAKTVAQLKHPHIVPVFEVGSTPEVPAFIVSEYIEGCTLAERLKQSPLPLPQAVQLVIDVAEALDYVHRSKAEVVHRDIKPGNLLLDQHERVYVADFGLALREVDLQQPQRPAGTPAYMSPEQIRGEGHRIDGQSDIFSLGVVLYELLTGRRPFRSNDADELRQQVTQHDPKPPRQINAEVPPELERICLKAMAKEVRVRYTTGHDLAADLRQLSGAVWGMGGMGGAPGVATPLTPLADGNGTSTPVTPDLATPASGTPGSGLPGSGSGSEGPPRRVAIVPKGLRSFDRDDAAFFLELLPGARDRDGLPESLRFWKQRIDPTPEGQTFSVGLLLGASGCGKSSLLKAGLLPRLSPDVLPIYLEATPDETERQLLTALVARLPRLERARDLPSALATIRRGEAGLGQRKLLLVLDQFEQWLHAHPVNVGLPLT
ncbi:MAG: serine/threonine-protein kinase, partial [Planctomycetaceae bacterium]